MIGTPRCSWSDAHPQQSSGVGQRYVREERISRAAFDFLANPIDSRTLPSPPWNGIPVSWLTCR